MPRSEGYVIYTGTGMRFSRCACGGSAHATDGDNLRSAAAVRVNIGLVVPPVVGVPFAVQAAVEMRSCCDGDSISSDATARSLEPRRSIGKPMICGRTVLRTVQVYRRLTPREHLH